MTQNLRGPFDDVYALARSPEASGSSDSLLSPGDPQLLRQLLRRYLEDPFQREALRRVLGPDYEGRYDDIDELASALAFRISRGGLVLQGGGYARGTVLPGFQSMVAGEIIEAPPRDEEEYIRDWRIECRHHTSASRALIEQGRSIQVVPDKGQIKDLVKIHYRDDRHPPPPSLRCGSTDVPKSGSSGGYDVYDFDAEYTGDITQQNFLFPKFWRAYLDKTNYTLSGGPSSVGVEVYNPRQYKFEFKFPALKGVNVGAQLTKGIKVEGRKLVAHGEPAPAWKITSTGWSPSDLNVNKTVARSDRPPVETDTPGVLQSVAFKIDGGEESVDIIQYVGTLLNFYSKVMEIIDAIQDNAPQVGWYFQFNMQLMQGGVTLEWYWKEHTDHRVFQYVDFNVALTVLSITFELGLGISGLGFKAQVFAQLSGGLTVSANARRDNPDGAPGFAIPAVTKITGALGARFEAGNLFKAEGKGETGIQVTVELGINRGRSSMVNFDAYADWTGIKVVATVSGGLFGMGRQKTWTRTLVSPRRMGGFQWPKPEKFSPPHASRSRIKSVLLGVITSGWNVRVIREVEGMFNDVTWTPDQIASALADKIDQHRTFHRTAKMIDGLAHAIRKDLDAAGARWGRDYIDETGFRQYVNGPELQAHLDGMVNPAAEIALAAGA